MGMVSSGMKWFRKHIKTGSRLALFALAIQFALSFGHFHPLPRRRRRRFQTGVTQADLASRQASRPDAAAQAAQQPADPSDGDQQPADACAICAVISLAGNVLFATPPVLQLPQAVELLYLTTDAEFVHLKSARISVPVPRASAS